MTPNHSTERCFQFDGKIAAEKKCKVALQTLFKSMLHRLMTGKIRVPEAVTSR